jgi:hypothetical protein
VWAFSIFLAFLYAFHALFSHILGFPRKSRSIPRLTERLETRLRNLTVSKVILATLAY